MPYLTATINETWRFANVIPVGLEHTAEVDLEINGYTVQKVSYQSFTSSPNMK
jgi:cytochrome P450